MNSIVRWLGAIGLLIGLAACGGGGGGDSGPSPSAAQTIGSDGGRIASESAEVIVPPGAMPSSVTIRIAADSTGAPTLPKWARAVGTMLQLTPHGSTFATPVTVRMAAPAVSLAANERLMIAKAQPGGTWEVLDDTQLVDGQLEARVTSFSYFSAVIVTYLPTAATSSFLPFGMSPIVFSCDGAACPTPILPSSTVLKASSSGNGGQLPADCVNATLDLRYRTKSLRSFPATPTVVVQEGVGWSSLDGLYADGSVTLDLYLVCRDPVSNATSALRVSSGTLAVDLFPSSAGVPVVRQFPAAMTVAEGEIQTLAAVLSRGASYRTGFSSFTAPSATDRAVVYLERLSAGDTSWRTVATKLQTEANPRPTLAAAWAYWGFDFPLAAVNAGDNGARYRIRACYQAPTAATTSCAIGPVATLTVVQQTLPPSFTLQPVPAGVVAGQTASFTVRAGGVPTPRLQWQARGSTGGAWSDLAGATEETFTTAALQVSDSGTQLRAVATNVAGTTASDVVTVTVSAAPVAPTITSQPLSLTVVTGGQAVFAVSASGTAALSYQWSRNGTPISGANGAQLKLAAVGAGDAGSYIVRVSNSAGNVVSASAVLTVSDAPGSAPVAPAIVTQPAALAVNEGNTATFAVGVTGSGPMTFQWRLNGVAIPGATAAAYTIAAVSTANAGNYSVVVGNAAGSETSASATLAVVPAAGTVTAPVISTQPVSVVVAQGATTTLAVAASGTGPLNYEWFRNGGAIAGATGPTYTLTGADPFYNGSYTVRVSNTAGSVTSAAAQILVIGLPQVVADPVPVSVGEGAAATFGVNATGDALRYQWLRNGVAINGATSSSYTTPALVLADSGAVYSVVVHNASGLAVSGGAVLTVTAAPSLADWRAPDTLLATGSSFQPSAGIDDAGRAHAVWHTGNRTYASVGTGTGGWSIAAPIDGGTLLNGYESRVAVSTGGKAVAVWGYQAGSAFRVAAAVFDGTTWLPPQRIDGSLTGNSQSVRVAIDASGRAVAVWAQATASGYIAMGRIFDGSTWAAPVTLDPGETGGSPAIAVNASGQGFVVWKRDTGELRAAPVDAVSGFSGSTSLRAAGSSSGMLRVVVDGLGNAWAVWIDSASSGWDLLARRYTPAGGWAAATTLSTNVGFPLDDRFTVAGGSGGHLLVAWTNSITTGGNDTIYGLRWKPGVGWSTVETLSTPGRAFAKLPTAAVDPTGRMNFVWTQADAANARSEAVARYHDGAAWGSPRQIQNSGGDLANTDQMGTGIASDGTAVAVWVEYAASGTEPVLGAFRR